MYGFSIHQGDRRYYLDTYTGTWGDCNDLQLFNDPPEDFSDWSDGERVAWVNKQNGVGD